MPVDPCIRYAYMRPYMYTYTYLIQACIHVYLYMHHASMHVHLYVHRVHTSTSYRSDTYSRAQFLHPELNPKPSERERKRERERVLGTILHIGSFFYLEYTPSLLHIGSFFFLDRSQNSLSFHIVSFLFLEYRSFFYLTPAGSRLLPGD
jgi:hypothetical protein